jgi:hypothetical protein
VPAPKEVSLMLQYLKSSNYTGSLSRAFRTINDSQAFLENQQKIGGLGILAALCMLQLHRPLKTPIITQKNEDVWSQVTDLKELNQTSAPIFFAIVQMVCLASPDVSKDKKVTEFMEAFKQRTAINLIQNLLEEPLLTHCSFKDQQGAFFNVLKSWLNLAFPFYK